MTNHPMLLMRDPPAEAQEPVAWRIDSPGNQWYTDDLEDATDALTNDGAVAVPLFEHPDPRIAELESQLAEYNKTFNAQAQADEEMARAFAAMKAELDACRKGTP